MASPLLRIRDLTISFPSAAGMVDAVDRLSLDVAAGETVGLVGESGSGKSLSSLAVMGLLAKPGHARGGSIMLGERDVLKMSPRALRLMRGKDVSMVFQEPLTALNPSLSVGRQLCDTIRAHRTATAREARAIAVQALAEVGIRDPERRLGAYPHEFSGGMRQRVLIAMAISCAPRLLIADEPTTALDVTVQAQIIDLLRRLRRERGLAILLIAHNLHLVAELCDRVVVMYAGRVMETGTTEQVFLRARHPYSRLLQACIPSLEDRGRRPTSIPGAAPRPGEISAGCPFAVRCPQAIPRCATARPELEGSGGHLAACWNPQLPDRRVERC